MHEVLYAEEMTTADLLQEFALQSRRAYKLLGNELNSRP